MKNLLNIFFDQQDREVLEEHVRRFLHHKPRTHQVIMKRLLPHLEDFPPLNLSCPAYVRLGDSPDAPQLVELETLGYDGYVAWTLEDFQDDLLTNPYAVYLLMMDESDQLLGFISGRFLARKAHISHLIIQPNYQGQGLGSYLLQRWIELVEYEGIPRIDLEVNADNQAAQQLYQKHGFVETGYVDNYYIELGQDAIQMQRVSRLEH